MHPEIVDDDGGGCLGYVFGDEAEVCASIGSASSECGLAVELMGDFGVGGHLLGVDFGGFRENRIEAKWLKTAIGAIFVCRSEKILLSYG